ncbi:D-tyrosyl-tRNA deacylase [Neoconidiobolus thromboides FSU 785]|nr:D-tyrosyl-tRNA deacylase [Neoconidiobolus thromboides FSU 785]
MRALIQRVKSGSVTVDGKIISSIGKGLLILVGITTKDEVKDIDFMIKKILNFRLFEDEEGNPWKKSVKDLDLEILSVSQFTLYAKVRKGNKPDFHRAMKSTDSKSFYTEFLNKLKSNYAENKVQDGEFGAMMDVQLINDGPVSIWIDSNDKEE